MLRPMNAPEEDDIHTSIQYRLYGHTASGTPPSSRFVVVAGHVAQAEGAAGGFLHQAGLFIVVAKRPGVEVRVDGAAGVAPGDPGALRRLQLVDRRRGDLLQRFAVPAVEPAVPDLPLNRRAVARMAEAVGLDRLGRVFLAETGGEVDADASFARRSGIRVFGEAGGDESALAGGRLGTGLDLGGRRAGAGGENNGGKDDRLHAGSLPNGLLAKPLTV